MGTSKKGRKNMFRGVAVFLLMLVAGCGSTVMTTDEYDKSCAVDADCVVVLVGDMCECGCDEGVISASEQGRYAAEEVEKRDNCFNALMCGACLSTGRGVCQQGTCVLAP